jgi:hypothetical protein
VLRIRRLIGKREGERAALSRTGTLRPDATTMGRNQPLGDIQPQPPAIDGRRLLFHPIEAIKDVLQAVPRNTEPLVLDGDAYLRPVILDPNKNLAAIRCVFHRVTEQILQDLLQPRAVPPPVGHGRRGDDPKRVPGAERFRLTGDVLHELGQVHIREGERQ